MVLPVGGIGSISSALPTTSSSGASGASGGGGFEKMLTDSLNSIDQAQTQSSQQTQAVATGQDSNLSSVVLSVEQASLEVSLASQIQTKAVDAYQSIFQTTV